jgi:hypothetical protein
MRWRMSSTVPKLTLDTGLGGMGMFIGLLLHNSKNCFPKLRVFKTAAETAAFLRARWWSSIHFLSVFNHLSSRGRSKRLQMRPALEQPKARHPKPDVDPYRMDSDPSANAADVVP